MNIDEAFEYISSATKKGSVLGLDRIRNILKLLGNPQDDLHFIHVGGTNGKGSTSAFLSFILKEAGYKTGLFTSPYIEVYNERIQVNNEYIPNDKLAEIIDYVKPFIDMADDAPTEFELNTIIALLYFKQQKCDVVVLEVGLGGEFDSTNIVKNKDLCILTSIGMDHMKELGDSIEEITKTKSKIIINGCDVVAYKQDEIILDLIKERCMEVDANLYISEPEKINIIYSDIYGQTLDIFDFGRVDISLAANYQVMNVALVYKAIQVLNEKGYNISDDAIKKGLLETRWPGRFEVIRKDPIIIVDGSHNLQGISATADSIKKIFGDKKLYIIMGVMADKEYEKMAEQIIPLAKEIYTVTPDNLRSLPALKLADTINEKGGCAKSYFSIKQSIKDAVYKAKSDGCAICAIGSLYLVGDIKKIVREMQV